MGLKAFAIFLFSILATSIVCIYIFIPSPIKVSNQIKTKGSEKNLYLIMSNGHHWNAWLKKEAVRSRFSYNFKNKIYPTILIEASSSDKVIPIKIEIHDADKSDSSILTWHCEISTDMTPWGKIQNYLEAREIKDAFSKVIKKFIEYTNETSNLYGIDIKEIQLKDTIIATLSTIESNPSSNSVTCKMTTDLRQEIEKSGLSITDSSMTAIWKIPDGKYKIMVGFPVNKWPDANSKLEIKKMIPGKLLIGTVYGGPLIIKNAHVQMRKFIMDHDKEEVALPYETSLTNRCTETDTTKWITRLCYPVY